MGLLPAVLILAVIQGITEFFPVSSSGHLVIIQHLLKYNNNQLLFDIILHLGTLSAVCFYFFQDLKSLVIRPLQPDNRRLIGMIVIASIPTAVIGIVFKDFFERLFSAPETVGYSLLVTALLLLLSKRIRIKPLHPLLAALVVGIFQGAAIAPGVSRSGATIAACLMLGLGFGFSFRFSFLLSIPAILGAAILEWRHLPMTPELSLPFILGFFVSACVGLLALALLKKIVLRDKFHYFAFYCIALGIAVIVMI